MDNPEWRTQQCYIFDNLQAEGRRFESVNAHKGLFPVIFRDCREFLFYNDFWYNPIPHDFTCDPFPLRLITFGYVIYLKSSDRLLCEQNQYLMLSRLCRLSIYVNLILLLKIVKILMDIWWFQNKAISLHSLTISKGV